MSNKHQITFVDDFKNCLIRKVGDTLYIDSYPSDDKLSEYSILTPTLPKKVNEATSLIDTDKEYVYLLVKQDCGKSRLISRYLPFEQRRSKFDIGE